MRASVYSAPQMSVNAALTGLQAVIFDMDGVLVDSEPVHNYAFQRVAEEVGHADHGLHFPSYLGKTDQVLWQEFVARHKPAHTVEELTARKTEVLMLALREQVSIFPGLRQLLHALQPRYKLALASGSLRRVVDGIIAGAGLEAFFP